MVAAAREEARESSQVIKGKRTKRPRPPSPLVVVASSSCGESITGNNNSSSNSTNNIDCGPAGLSLADMVDKAPEVVMMTEEEDMANCLILLSRAGRRPQVDDACEVFRCKTCDKSFPSFQALGGHRASHKKPKNGKLADQETRDSGSRNEEPSEEAAGEFNTTLSLEMPARAYGGAGNVKAGKMHECSICGAEFSSGQALGGHMRRHRPIGTNSSTSTTTATTTTTNVGAHRSNRSQESTKRKNEILQLDLNLPAPEDDVHHGPKFSLSAKEQVIVFTASPLVDCHY